MCVCVCVFVCVCVCVCVERMRLPEENYVYAIHEIINC